MDAGCLWHCPNDILFFYILHVHAQKHLKGWMINGMVREAVAFTIFFTFPGLSEKLHEHIFNNQMGRSDYKDHKRWERKSLKSIFWVPQRYVVAWNHITGKNVFEVV